MDEWINALENQTGNLLRAVFNHGGHKQIAPKIGQEMIKQAGLSNEMHEEKVSTVFWWMFVKLPHEDEVAQLHIVVLAKQLPIPSQFPIAPVLGQKAACSNDHPVPLDDKKGAGSVDIDMDQIVVSKARSV